MRAVNAKGEGEFSSPSAPEHPLRPPDAPPAPVGERGDKTITVRWSAARQRWRPDHRVRGADPLDRGREHDDGHVDALGQPAQRPAPAVPGAGPQPRRVGRVVGGVGGRRAVRRPRRTGRRRRRARRRRGDRDVGGARRPGLRDHRLHGAANGGRRSNVGGGADVGDVRRASATARRYTFTVVARNEVGDGAASPPSNAVVAGRPAVRPEDHRAPRPTPAASPSRGAPAEPQRQRRSRRTSWRSTAAAGRTSVPGTSYSRDRAGQRHDVLVPGARRERRRRRRRGQHRAGPHARPPAQVGGLDVDRRRPPDPRHWSAPNDNGKPITDYEVDIAPRRQRRQRDGPLAHVDRARLRARRYTVRVRACNEVGCGAWSAERRPRRRPRRATSRGARGRSRRRPAQLRHAAVRVLPRQRLGHGARTPSYQVNCYGDDGRGIRSSTPGRRTSAAGGREHRPGRLVLLRATAAPRVRHPQRHPIEHQHLVTAQGATT